MPHTIQLINIIIDIIIFSNQDQGDQIGRIFNIWLLFTWVFFKFYLNKQFQNTQKQFYALMFDFQFELV